MEDNCVHHWLIPSKSERGYYLGECLNCHETRAFPIVDGNWHDTWVRRKTFQEILDRDGMNRDINQLTH